MYITGYFNKFLGNFDKIEEDCRITKTSVCQNRSLNCTFYTFLSLIFKLFHKRARIKKKEKFVARNLFAKKENAYESTRRNKKNL